MIWTSYYNLYINNNDVAQCTRRSYNYHLSYIVYTGVILLLAEYNPLLNVLFLCNLNIGLCLLFVHSSVKG